MNMLIDDANPKTVRDVVEQYETLLWIERNTPNRTNKTRNQLLQHLEPADLVAVSMELKKRGLIGGGSR
jgi:hypothetical protein